MKKLSQVFEATAALIGMGTESKRASESLPSVDDLVKHELQDNYVPAHLFSLSKPSPVYIGVTLPKKEWKKRKVSRRIAKNSRKANRK